MRAVLAALRAWDAAGLPGALARVVATEGSSPRDPGAAMAVSADGGVVGSLSGGCVEAAVVEDALDVLERRVPRRRRFGYSDADALEIGLTCGGELDVYIEPYRWPAAGADALLGALGGSSPSGVATLLEAARGPAGAGAALILAGDTTFGSLGDAELDRVVGRDLVAVADTASASAVRRYGCRGEALQEDVTIFLQGFAPARRLVVVGATDFAAALCAQAKLLGYHVTVCDARAAFATAARLPAADEVVVDWPDRHLSALEPALGPRDAVCVLSHDPKFDVPALRAALAQGAGYIGAMGSRRTVADRRARLAAAGVDAAALARIRMPIGLDLGARTPAETAVSICAEMILTGRGGVGGLPLSAGAGPIHPAGA